MLNMADIALAGGLQIFFAFCILHWRS